MPAAAKPSLRFVYSAAQRKKALDLLDTIEASGNPAEHQQKFGDLVMELTEAGFDYFYLKPLDLAGMGFLVRQSAGLAISGALRIMSPVVRNIIDRMDNDQLLKVCGFVRLLMK